MIRAKYIMCKRAAVKQSESGKEVVFKMMGTGCPGLPVVNDEMETVGIITAFSQSHSKRGEYRYTRSGQGHVQSSIVG
jgi:hypothetical protein